MTILGNIIGGILGRRRAEAAARSQPAPAPSAPPAPTPGQPGAAGIGTSPQPQPAPEAVEPVDIAAILDEKNQGKNLNWRTSIVDLMKLVGMESSLAERRELADELGYTGDKGDTATMNIWLHKQVMKRLAENGGRLPADLAD